MSNLNFSVAGQSQSATRFEAKARNFSFIVDEPEALGGTDDGPNPVEYLLGSYAGCLNVVVHLVAKEQGVTINNLHIEVNGELDPARFTGQPGFNRPGFQHINVQVTVDTAASQETVYKVLEIAKSRPVNDNLSNVTQVNYTVKKS
jgi:uncharacterized OsmC-like protein